jgi:hypothetical protein
VGVRACGACALGASPAEHSFLFPRGLAIADGARASPCGELGEGAPQVSLFSGLVGSDAMQAAFKKVSTSGSALRFGGAPRAERVVMAGPGGRGRVEVAVTEPPAQPEVRPRCVARVLPPLH